MTNLLEQAINSNDGDVPPSFRRRSAFRGMMLSTTSSRRRGRATVSNAPGSSANGCRLRRVFLPRDRGDRRSRSSFP